METQRTLSRPEATSGAADLRAPGDLSSSAASYADHLRATIVAPATMNTYAEAFRTLAGFVASAARRPMPRSSAENTSTPSRYGTSGAGQQDGASRPPSSLPR